MLSLLLYGIVFYAGYGLCHLLNLATRRVLVCHLHYGGLAFVAVFALGHAALLQSAMPSDLSPEAQGEVIGQHVLGPALFVAVAAVGILWWRRRQNARRGNR